jgi:hypothetical protein
VLCRPLTSQLSTAPLTFSFVSLHTASPSQGWLKLPASTTCMRVCVQQLDTGGTTNSVSDAAVCSKGVCVCAAFCFALAGSNSPVMQGCWLQSGCTQQGTGGLALPQHSQMPTLTPQQLLSCLAHRHAACLSQLLTCSGGPWSCQPPLPPPKPPLPPPRPPPLPPKPPTLPAPLGGRILCQVCRVCCRC